MEPIAYIRNCAPEGATPEWYEVHESFSDSEGVIAVVPLAEYEKLRVELELADMYNEGLDFKFKHYCGRIKKVLQRHRERQKAQAQRIAELEARTLDIPEGYKVILVLNEYAPPTPDYNECYRNADLATGVTHRCKSWVSVFIREINRWCYQRDDQHKYEIESLRKQVEELSQPIPDWKIELLFNRAMDYRELRISEAAYDNAVREILAASKNGE